MDLAYDSKIRSPSRNWTDLRFKYKDPFQKLTWLTIHIEGPFSQIGLTDDPTIWGHFSKLGLSDVPNSGTFRDIWLYAFNARWVLGCRGAPVRWVVEVAFWSPSEPIGKCLMPNLENTNSSRYSRLSVSVDPEELIKGATLLGWVPKSSENYWVFLIFWWRSSVSFCKSDDFHIWRLFGARFYQVDFPRPKQTYKKLPCLILFWAPSSCPESASSEVGVLSARENTGNDFFQNITFYLPERQLFNVVRDDYPCRPPEGTAEAHGQGPAAGLCWGPWKSGCDHPASWLCHCPAETPPAWAQLPAVRWPPSIKGIVPYTVRTSMDFWAGDIGPYDPYMTFPLEITGRTTQKWPGGEVGPQMFKMTNVHEKMILQKKTLASSNSRCCTGNQIIGNKWKRTS